MMRTTCMDSEPATLEPSEPAIEPTHFSAAEPAPSVVIACSYDPLGLHGPLQTWRRLTGQRCVLHWVVYGKLLEALSNPESAWCTNSSGLNVLILRWADVGAEAAAFVAALRAASEAWRCPTLVLLPPGAEAPAAHDRTDELRSVAGVTDLGVGLGQRYMNKRLYM